MSYFQNERDERIGIIQAEQILDLVMEKLILAGYNKGIEDAKSLLQEKIADINIDFDLLLK